MISFHGRVKKAELFASEIHDAIDLVSDEHRPKGELYTDYVSGMMVSSKRRLKLSKLKTLHDADRGLLTNARCLSEGIDVPSLDGVAFIDPRSSQVDIIQAVGRAIRKLRNKPEEKAFGTIVLPVFIEETDDAEKSILSSNFKPIWGILNALKSHDETLSLELGQIRTNLGRQLSSGSASQSIPEKIIFDLPTTIDSSFADSLKTILIENTTDSWDFWFGLFQKYIENTNSLLIDNTFKTEGYALGNWVMAQRQRKKQGSLNQERIEKLNSLGFIWDVGELEWEEGIKHFIEFCESNNTHIVPQKHICDDGFTLGSWCNSRRQDYRTDVLKQSKINELNSIGFIWDVDQHKWNTEYENLKIFKKKYGHTNTTSVYDRENKVRLGKWCGHQRTAKKNKKLSLDRIKKLNQLDFIWELQTTILTNQWDKKYTLLEKYFEEKGDTYVDFRHSTKDGVKLGIFVATQRANRKKGLLSQDEIKKLDKLNFLWDVTEQRWLITYNELKKYTAEHGTAKVTRDYKTADGLRLGDWSNRQKYQNAINNLSKKRKDLLELLNGWDWIKTTVKEKK